MKLHGSTETQKLMTVGHPARTGIGDKTERSYVTKNGVVKA